MRLNRMTEATIKASALGPEIHEAMTEGKRFNFKLVEGGREMLLTARASQADQPGLIRIHDFRPV